MKPLRISEDVVPVGEFKAHVAQWLRHASQSGEPVLITQSGRAAGVLLSPVQYDRLAAREAFVESVARGLDDAQEGRVMTTAKLRERIVARRRAAK